MVENGDDGLRRIRSPGYPALNLQAAIEKAYDVYRAEGRNAAALPVTLQHWGYSQKSGNGMKALAALKSFGLVEVTGSGESQRIKLSDLALRIILDDRENSAERAKAIATAALRPKIHRRLWNLWGAEMPSHGNIRHYLIFDEKFNENFVDDFIGEYKSTIEYANIENLSAVEASTVSDDVQEARNTAPLPSAKTRNLSDIHSSPLPGHEIAKFPVGNQCTISLIANGEVFRKSIEALVAQLKLNLELGLFDDPRSESEDVQED